MSPFTGVHTLAQTNAAPSDAVDAVWRVQTHWTFAPWLTVLLIAGAAALVVYCYAREASPAGVGYRTLLGVLRLTTIALILIMLTELLLAGTRSGRPRFGWVLDVSGSMTATDRHAGAQAGGGAAPRIERAKQWLLADDARLLLGVGESFDVEAVAAGDEATPLGQDAGLPEAIAALSAQESAATRLGDAVHGLVERASAPPPQAVVVVTDGRNTAGRSLSAAAESAHRAGTPLYFVGVGSRRGPPDIALSDPLADEVVFVEDLVSIGATLRVEGDVPEPIRVTLRRDGEPEVLAERVVQAQASRTATPVQLIHRPETEGDYRYVIEAAGVDGERDTQNNRVHADVQVRDAQVRVLLTAGYPMYEFRYLKNLLERDSTVSLKTYLQEADLEYATADETAIARFPLRRDELREYDVVVLMDLDPQLLPRSAWASLREFVANDGGGLALVAGPRYFPWTYRGLADFRPLAPIELDTTPVDGVLVDDGFRLRPTELGLRSASMQLGDDRAGSESIWRSLAPLYWYAEVGELKPAAQVLAEHPAATTAEGRAVPLVVSQYFGGGHVLVHAVDSTYRWRQRVGDVYFARYWVQTLRRLARGRLLRDERGWELTVERGEYERGEPVTVRLRTPEPVDQADVLLQPESGPQERLTLRPSAARPGLLEATLEDLPTGAYRALLADAVTGDGVTSAAFDVVSPPGEFARLEMDVDAMTAAAQQTGGAFLTIDEAGRLLEALPEARPVPIESLPPVELWNRWWMLAGVFGCLICEWVLRKRKSML